MTDNPSAFPVIYGDGAGFSEGMTLRDYFAGQALAGLVGSAAVANGEDVADVAYQLADAMLQERKKGQSNDTS